MTTKPRSPVKISDTRTDNPDTLPPNRGFRIEITQCGYEVHALKNGAVVATCGNQAAAWIIAALLNKDEAERWYNGEASRWI